MSYRIRKLFILTFIASTCLFVKFIEHPEVVAAVQLNSKEPYNVILIIIDVLRPDHLGCYGCLNQASPAIDEIAKESCMFENAFSQDIYSLASKISIFTSIYPSSHGVRFVFNDKLSARAKTMAEIFSTYGYHTAWFSSFKEPHPETDNGFYRGFQDKAAGRLPEGRDEVISWLQKNKSIKFFITIESKRVADYYYLPETSFDNVVSRDSRNPIMVLGESDELDKALYYRLVKLIKSKILTFSDPGIISDHKELFNGEYSKKKLSEIEGLVNISKREKLQKIREDLRVSLLKRAARKNNKSWITAYDACIQATDKELIKPIKEELLALGLYDKTILVITADHGEGLGEHDIYGHGYAFFDEFYHVPLIIKMPYSKVGKRISKLVQSIDIMPTVLDIAGIDVPHQAQGKSLLGLMAGAVVSSPHEYIFSENLGEKSIRSDEWKFFIDSYGKKTLFNLRFDPKERYNVYSENIPVAKELEAELNKWKSSLPSYKDKK